MSRTALQILAAVLVVATGFAVGRGTMAQPADAVGTQAAKYPLLSRSILADNSNDILINFVDLRKQLNDKFSTLPAGAPKSFYFEYLPDGTSVRQGADTDLVAASLIKTPLAMNVFRAAELGKLDLDKPYKVTAAEIDGGYGDLWRKGPGFTLTLRQAAAHALEESDDTAMHFMFDHVNGLLPYNQQSLAGLDIDQNLTNGQAVINARAFSSVLKSLYYSSFLTMADSEQLLGFLTKSTEHSRLTKLLPAGTVVAHKNGVNVTSGTQSDCGIVYIPQRPYILCTMVGLPYDQAGDFISNVSKTVYDYVKTQ